MLRLLQPPDRVSVQIQVELDVRYNPEFFYCPAIVKNRMLVIGKHQDKIRPLAGFVGFWVPFGVLFGVSPGVSWSPWAPPGRAWALAGHLHD